MLVAIAIPVFTTQLNKSQLATDVSNTRADLAEQIATALVDGTTDDDGKVTVSLTYSPQYSTLSGGGDYGTAITLTHSKDDSLSQDIPVDDNVKVNVS